MLCTAHLQSARSTTLTMIAPRQRVRVSVEQIVLDISDLSEGFPNVLLLIPGIRNSGLFGRQIKDVIYAHGIPIKPRRINYGRYGVWRFFAEIFVPPLRAKRTLNDIRSKIRDEMALAHDRTVSVLCHSNATKLFAEVCKDLDLSFHRIILFASVCNDRDIRVLARRCGRVVNVVAGRDHVPIVAEAMFPLRFSRTGQAGCKEDWAEDIFYEYNHNDIFTEAVIKDVIVPITVFGKIEYKFNVGALAQWHSPTNYRLLALLLAILLLGLLVALR